MNMTSTLVFICTVLSSIVFGASIGFNYGIKRGVELSMETAIKETVKNLYKEFKRLGMDEQFTSIVNKVFDSKKIKLWEDEK